MIVVSMIQPSTSVRVKSIVPAQKPSPGLLVAQLAGIGDHRNVKGPQLPPSGFTNIIASQSPVQVGGVMVGLAKIGGGDAITTVSKIVQPFASVIIIGLSPTQRATGLGVVSPLNGQKTVRGDVPPAGNENA